jgi:hypothetical protein
MNQVRPRFRKQELVRAREVQGMFAMQGLEGETDFATERGKLPDTRRVPHTRPQRASELKPLPYRLVLADWPIEWRERWGRRANDLEASGLTWRDAEGRAFVDVWNEWRLASEVARN